MILFLLAAAAGQPQAEGPKDFMQRLYAGYRKQDYSPFDHPERVFAPRLRTAIAEDFKLANGEVGYLDGDPICQCQDAAGLRATVVSVAQRNRHSATVRVSISLARYKPRPARFELERGPTGWRIADVSSPQEQSLLGALEQSNQQQRKKQ